MAITLKEAHLRRLCAINNFPAPDAAVGNMILFGLRGCLPLMEGSQQFAEQHEVEITAVNYQNPCCTIGQWLPAERKFALFPGSTVPHISGVRQGLARGGQGVNQLMTGYYKDYRKGIHKAGTPTGHPAFRQTEGRPIRRTADDLDFDNDDRVEVRNPFDNIHAGWSMGGSQSSFSSLGCQVVVGYPRCPRREDRPDSGPWRIFKSNAYSLTQDRFPYFLLNGGDARVVATSDAPLPAKLRFGSQSALVGQVQEKLKAQGFYEGILDASFGERTLRSVLEFQIARFGPDADDGIVGPITASELDLAWPRV